MQSPSMERRADAFLNALHPLPREERNTTSIFWRAFLRCWMLVPLGILLSLASRSPNSYTYDGAAQ